MAKKSTAKQQFKYVVEVVVTFTSKVPKRVVREGVEHAIQNAMITERVRVRSVDLE